jgi:threonine aldolase
MRQAGIIAAAGVLALDTMIDRLADDHDNAALLADELAAVQGIAVDPIRVRTNMVRFQVLDPALPHQQLIELAQEQGVRLAELGHGRIRAVTHRGVEAADIKHAVAVIADIVRAHTRKVS